MILGVRSFGFKALPHMEANDIFNRGFVVLAGVIGVDVDDLVHQAMERNY